MTISPCFDAGSRYCPCELAELGQCVACSILRGEETCDCGWSGLCVYADFMRNNKKARPTRRRVTATVKSRSEISEGPGVRAFLAELETPREIALWCGFPGSFVLVRPKDSPERYNVPLSVMQATETGVSLAMQVAGPKTAALYRECREGKSVTVSGPFWSGLQGLTHLREASGGRTLIVAKGIAQGCGVLAAKYAKDRGGYVKALMGPGPVGRVFADEAARETGCVVEILPKSKDHNTARVFVELVTGGYDLLVSLGSDAQHLSLKGLAGSLERPPQFAWSSNLSMTCAEGICGSCLVQGFRGCKANLPDGFRFDA